MSPLTFEIHQGGQLVRTETSSPRMSSRWASSRRRTCASTRRTSRACTPSSRRRARAEVFITDLGSTRGTPLVNGQRSQGQDAPLLRRRDPVREHARRRPRWRGAGRRSGAAPRRWRQRAGDGDGHQGVRAPAGRDSPAAPPLRVAAVGGLRPWPPRCRRPRRGGTSPPPQPAAAAVQAPAYVPPPYMAPPIDPSAVEVRAKPFAAGPRLTNTDIFFQGPQARSLIKKTISHLYPYLRPLISAPRAALLYTFAHSRSA